MGPSSKTAPNMITAHVAFFFYSSAAINVKKANNGFIEQNDDAF